MRLSHATIDCDVPGWKILLERNLKDEVEVTLMNLDLPAFLSFCEKLANTHSMRLNLDSQRRVTFLKTEPTPP